MFPTLAQLRLTEYVYAKSTDININTQTDLIKNILNPVMRFQKSVELLNIKCSKTKLEVNIELNKELVIYKNLTCCYLTKQNLTFSFGDIVNQIRIDSTVSTTDLVNSYMLRHGYWIEEYIGSHLHVICPDNEVNITNGKTCDCKEFEFSGYKSCIHTNFARMYLQNRQKLDFIAVVY